MPPKTRIPKTPIVVGKKRTCDACPRRYIPVTKTHRFHSTACRLDYHRFGPVLNLLADRIEREVSLRAPDILYTVWLAADEQMRRRFPADVRRDFESREADSL